MASAGPLLNTDSTVGYSGLTRSIINEFGSERTFVSGGNIQVASGAGCLTAVIPSIASGVTLSGGGATFSGVILWVYDAISGITAPHLSGNGILWNVAFGTQSGFLTGGFPAIPPPAYGINAIFKSGLNVTISGSNAIGLTVVWSKGV